MSEAVTLSKEASVLVTALAQTRHEPPTRTADRAIGTAAFLDREIRQGSEVLIKRPDGTMVQVTQF